MSLKSSVADLEPTHSLFRRRTTDENALVKSSFELTNILVYSERQYQQLVGLLLSILITSNGSFVCQTVGPVRTSSTEGNL